MSLARPARNPDLLPSSVSVAPRWMRTESGVLGERSLVPRCGCSRGRGVDTGLGSEVLEETPSLHHPPQGMPDGGGELPSNGAECSTRPLSAAAFLLLPRRQYPHLARVLRIPLGAPLTPCSGGFSTLQGAWGAGTLREAPALAGPWRPAGHLPLRLGPWLPHRRR